MTRYLTSSDPDGAHVLEAELPAVQAPGDGEPGEFFEVGFTNDGDYGTSAVIAEENLVVTVFGEHRSVPPRGPAPEHTEQSAAGRVTGGISNAHPDLTFGDVQANGEPEPEPEVEPEPEPETEPGPADIPPPPEVPEPEAPAENEE